MTQSRQPTHVCLDCGALGVAGGYHDHGNNNAGETIALEALPRMMSAFHDVEMERDELEAYVNALRPALRDAIEAVSGVVRHMPSPTYTPQVSLERVKRWRKALDDGE